MMSIHAVLFSLVFVLLSQNATPSAQGCRDWQACQTLALAAADRHEYEAFHDLAWRTLQLGPKNDPGLMLLLARAQSLSGRPADALVMLQRLVASAKTSEVAEAVKSDDFERVRALPAWAEVEAKLSGVSAPPVSTPPTPRTTPTPEPPRPVTPAPAPTPAVPTPATSERVTPEPKSAKKAPSTSRAEPRAVTPAPLTFAASGLTAVGLAYDAVSGRFLIGDRQERRLVVVGERSGRLASLAGSDAGFNEVTALEIDTHEGDLWVVSASSPPGVSTVHKLQLVSGRVLTSIAIPSEQAPARFSDVAVTPQTILVLDSEGRRVFRVAKGGKALELATRLGVPNVTSLAPASETSAYAAYDQGLLHVDLASRAITVVEPDGKTNLTGLTWMRWHRGTLVALQKDASGTYRFLRVRLDATGRAVRGADVLADDVSIAGPTSATISGGALYYLNRNAEDTIEMKKIVLK
jgi:hypothetical protein